jgi:hypothetical protein
MKKNGSRKSFRDTLRRAMTLHEGRLRDLLAELEGGARLSRWVQEMSNEFGAGVELMRILVKEHNEKHPRRRVEIPEARS